MEGEKKKSGLVYVSDDSPLLPEIRKGQRTSRQPVAAISRPTVSLEPEIVDFIPRKSFLREGMLIGVLAGATFLLVMAASAFFVLDVSVGSTESASIQFSLPN